MGNEFVYESNLYSCNDLNDVVDFTNKHPFEIKAMINEMLNRQRAINNQTPDGILKQLFEMRVKQVQAHKVNEIASRLTGKMTFAQIQQIILSYF